MPLLSIPNEHGERIETADRNESPDAPRQLSLARTLARLGREHHHHDLRVRIADCGVLELYFEQRRFHVDFPLADLPRALNARRYVLTAIGTRAAAPEAGTGEDSIADLFWIAAQQLQNGSHAKHQAGHQREQQREGENPAVKVHRDSGRQLRSQERDEEAEASPRQQDAQYSAGQGKHGTLRKQLPGEAHMSGAQ